MCLVEFTNGTFRRTSARLFLWIHVYCLGSFLRYVACFAWFLVQSQFQYSCCRGDEDVEDVFFLDEGANVMAAVSDRCDNMMRVCVCVFSSSARCVIRNRRGGAVVSDFRSAADVVRSKPSIGKHNYLHAFFC